MRWIFFYLAVLSLSLSYIGCSKQHNVETIQNVTTEPSAYSENDKEIIEDTDEDKLNVNDSVFMKLSEIYDNMLLKSGESKCRFQHLSPVFLYKIPYHVKYRHKIAYDKEAFYVIGNPTLRYKFINGLPDADNAELMYDLNVYFFTPEYIIHGITDENGDDYRSIAGYSLKEKRTVWKLDAKRDFLICLYHSHLYILSPVSGNHNLDNNSERENTRLSKYALDGTLVWERELKTLDQMEHRHLRFAAAFDNNIYIMDNYSFLGAYNESNGEEIWTNTVSGWVSFRTGASVDQKNRTIAGLDSALDLDTGKPVRADLEIERNCPYPVAVSDGIIFSENICNENVLSAHDSLTGKRIWDVKIKEEDLFEPFVADGYYVCSYDESNHFVAGDLIISTKNFFPDIIARNKYTGELVWRFPYREGGRLRSGMISCQDDKLFVIEENEIYVYGYKDSFSGR